MKLAILHLSDMHFEKETDFDSEKVGMIVRSLQFDHSIENVLIVVSGDITLGGVKSQFIVANQFLKDIECEIKKQYNNAQNVEYVVVPGNHDVAINDDESILSKIKERKDNNFNVQFFSNDIEGMGWFFDSVSEDYNCWGDGNKFISQKEINVGTKKILVNMINTAMFSLSGGKDKGWHCLPNFEIEKLGRSVSADFVFTIMHHSYHWFIPKQKNLLMKYLYDGSDIIFFGHEHEAIAIDVENKIGNVQEHLAGKLCNKGEWTQSTFYVSILDLDTRFMETKRYNISNSNAVYKEIECKEEFIKKKNKNIYGISFKSDFLIFLKRDSILNRELSDFFVFPLMREINVQNEKKIGCDISDLYTLIKKLEQNKRMLFIGKQGVGKTALIKQLILHLCTNFFISFISNNDIKSNNFNSCIRHKYDEMYGLENEDGWSLFQQDKNKLLFVDGVEKINYKILIEFLSKAEDEFGTICLFMNEDIEFDVEKRVQQTGIKSIYTTYEILPFFSDKREMLVKNVVVAENIIEDIEQDRIVNDICHILNTQKKIFVYHPEFIIRFVMYYCRNIGDTTVCNDGEIFSKVFEAKLTMLIRDNVKKYPVNQVEIVLDKIAYEIHTKRKYPISFDDLVLVVRNYKEKYAEENLDINDFISSMVKSCVLKYTDKGYFFCEKSYLAYFVAREIKRKVLAEHDNTEFQKLLTLSCFDINAEILMFITYITDDPNIINMIVGIAEKSISEWMEFNPQNKEITYLTQKNLVEDRSSIIEDNERENYKQLCLKNEQDDAKTLKVNNDESLYSFSETIQFMDEIVRALSLMILIARILPCFGPQIEAELKDRCIRLIYLMPLKIFGRWASEIEKTKEQQIEKLKRINSDDYRILAETILSKGYLEVLQQESKILLLQLMDFSMNTAVRESSIGYLKSFFSRNNLSDNIDLYRIEYLIALDRIDKYKDFLVQLSILIKNNQIPFTRNIIKFVVWHYMLTTRKTNERDIIKLNMLMNSGLGHGDKQIANARVLVERTKITNAIE